MDATPDKKTLRATIRAARRARARAASDLERREAADRLAVGALEALDTLCPGWDASGSSVALYRATAAEPPTGALALALADRGVRIIVPRTRADLDLEWHELRIAPGDDARAAILAPGPMPRRPTADAPGTADAPVDEGPSLGVDGLSAASAVVTPGLAVDVDGYRLGQGGGCYDRALRRRGPRVPAVTLLFDGEILPAVPRDVHDVPVDGVVTPTRGWSPLPTGRPDLGH